MSDQDKYELHEIEQRFFKRRARQKMYRKQLVLMIFSVMIAVLLSLILLEYFQLAKFDLLAQLSNSENIAKTISLAALLIALIVAIPSFYKNILSFLEISRPRTKINMNEDYILHLIHTKFEEFDRKIQSELYKNSNVGVAEKVEGEFKERLEQHLKAIITKSTTEKIQKEVEQGLLEKIGQNPAIVQLSDLISELRQERQQVTIKANSLLLVGSIFVLLSWGPIVWMFFDDNITKAVADGKSIAGIIALRSTSSLFGASFALFFLQQYRNGVSDRKFYQNEISNLTAMMSAALLAQRSDQTADLTNVIDKLILTERNFVLKKGESTVANQKTASDYQLLYKAFDESKNKK